MKSIQKFILPILTIAFAFSGCYPGGPEYAEDVDVVVTNYSNEYWEANQPKTYFMPDSLGWILDRDDLDNISDDLTRDYDEFVLGVVEENLAALGYVRIDDVSEENWPDLFVFTQALAIKNTQIDYIPWYPWWGGWYPWWGGWGGYYPGYVPVAYSFSTGTILIEIGDAKNLNIEQQLINIVWTAGIDGLLRSSSSSNQQFVRQNIEQAFNQSPYLNAN